VVALRRGTCWLVASRLYLPRRQRRPCASRPGGAKLELFCALCQQQYRSAFVRFHGATGAALVWLFRLLVPQPRVCRDCGAAGSAGQDDHAVDRIPTGTTSSAAVFGLVRSGAVRRYCRCLTAQIVVSDHGRRRTPTHAELIDTREGSSRPLLHSGELVLLLAAEQVDQAALDALALEDGVVDLLRDRHLDAQLGGQLER
jgi:hypothetical protein